MLAAVERLAPVEHVPSVDEAALRVPRREDPGAFLEAVGEAVPRALGEAVQVSLGAAPSLLLAKLAAGSAKPRARVVAAGPEPFAHLPVRSLCGVGPAMEARPAFSGVRTVGDLAKVGPATARALWGSRTGRDVWLELAGWDLPADRAAPRRVSHARGLGPKESPRAVLRGLAVLVGERLRRRAASAPETRP